MKHSLSHCKQILTSAALAAVTIGALACAPAHAWQGKWYDGSLQQFYPLVSAPNIVQFGNCEVSSGGYSTIDGTTGSGLSFKGLPGGWIRYDLRVPNTKGNVRLKLNKVRIYWPSGYSGRAYRIEVCNSDNPDTGTWTSVVNTTVAASGAYQDHVLSTSTEMKFVRVVNAGTSNTWLNFSEIDFWGQTVEENGAETFNQPGTILKKAGLDLMKQRINNGTHPAGVTLTELTNRWPATAYYGQATTFITADRSGDVNTGYLEDDTRKAYENALMWYITGNTEYAKNVQRIADDWATTCTTFNGNATELGSGMWPVGFLQAMDIVKHSYPGWDLAMENRFFDWLNVHASPKWETQNSRTPNNGNWATLNRHASINFAVVNGDRYHFNRLIEIWRLQIAAETRPWGQVRETTRDMSHHNMFLAGAIGTAEVAWNQGVDLYAWSESGDSQSSGTASGVTYAGAPALGYRLANALDYAAEIYNKGGLPENGVTPFPSNTIYNYTNWQEFIRAFDNGSAVTGDNGNGSPSPLFGSSHGLWEIGFNHYTNVKNKSFPELGKRFTYARANSFRDAYIHGSGHGTITHAGLGNPSGTIRVEAYNPPAQKSSSDGISDVHRVFTDSGASVGQCAILESNAAGDWVAYDVPDVQLVKYDIYMQFKKGTDRGKCQVSIAGVTNSTAGSFTNHGIEHDLYNTSFSLNRIKITQLTFASAGTKRFKFTCTGSNGSSSNKFMAIDYIELVPVP